MSKFNSRSDEEVYLLAQDEPWDGDVDSPTGAYCKIDLNQPGDDTALANRIYGSPFVLVDENSQGFVTVHGFADEKSRDRTYQDRENAYALWSAEVPESDAMDAIAAYRVALRWSSSDGEVYFDDEKYEPFEFSIEAQQKITNDVVGFITSNIDEVRAFLDVTGLGWGQVGHDFALTRNHHGAGFDDRGAAGPAVDALVESSLAWGDATVYLSDDNELEIM